MRLLKVKQRGKRDVAKRVAFLTGRLVGARKHADQTNLAAENQTQLILKPIERRPQRELIYPQARENDRPNETHNVERGDVSRFLRLTPPARQTDYSLVSSSLVFGVLSSYLADGIEAVSFVPSTL